VPKKSTKTNRILHKKICKSETQQKTHLLTGVLETIADNKGSIDTILQLFFDTQASTSKAILNYYFSILRSKGDHIHSTTRTVSSVDSLFASTGCAAVVVVITLLVLLLSIFPTGEYHCIFPSLLQERDKLLLVVGTRSLYHHTITNIKVIPETGW